MIETVFALLIFLGCCILQQRFSNKHFLIGFAIPFVFLCVAALIYVIADSGIEYSVFNETSALVVAFMALVLLVVFFVERVKNKK